MKVQNFLREHEIPFRPLEHRPTYDAQSLAQAVHVPGDEVAKAVLLKVDGKFVLAVLPATHTVDLEMVKRAMKARHAALATEEECGTCFDDCELGSLPPFGSQYGVKTIFDESLLEDEEIVVAGNTHEEAVRLNVEDYRALELPLLAKFARHV